MKYNVDKIRGSAWRVFAACWIVAIMCLVGIFDYDSFYVCSSIMIICGMVVILSLNAVIACEFLEVANNKGYYSIKYFWYCFLFGIVGWLLVIALPDMSNRVMMNKMLNAINKEDKQHTNGAA